MKKGSILITAGLTVIYFVDRLAAIDGALNTIKRFMELTPQTFSVIKNVLHVLSILSFVAFIVFINWVIIKFEKRLDELSLKESDFTKNILEQMATFEKSISGSQATFEKSISGSQVSFEKSISGSQATFEKSISESQATFEKSISGNSDKLDKQYDYFRKEDGEIRDEYRKRDTEIDIKFYNKIYALKVFRDKEMIRITDHYNAQLKTFEDRFKIIQEVLKENNIAISLSDKVEITDPNYIKALKESDKGKIQEIIEYNEAFKDWNIGDYGTGNKQTIYGKDYSIIS